MTNTFTTATQQLIDAARLVEQNGIRCRPSLARLAQAEAILDEYSRVLLPLTNSRIFQRDYPALHQKFIQIQTAANLQKDLRT